MGKKILIADDEERIRKLVRKVLEFSDDDFEIYEAEDGIEAAKKVEEIRPQLVILDVMMPGKSGYEVCKDIKSNPETKDIFILFLTARGNLLSEKTGTMSGGDEYMLKPFDPEELEFKEKRVLGLE